VSEFEAALRRQHGRLHDAFGAGMPRLGWKLCVNEPRHQRRLGLAGPFVGFLNGACRLASGDVCRLPPHASYAVEPEIAIRVGPSPGQAIAALAPAFEIVDYTRGAFSLAGVVESSSFHHGVVLGAARPPTDAPVIGPDCPRVLQDAMPVGVPDPALVPSDLTDVVRFVARFLAEHGERLEADDWILSGACTAPVSVGRGETVDADFGPLGRVQVRFASDPPGG